jgi:uncharacterized protein (TIGR03435 family)
MRRAIHNACLAATLVCMSAGQSVNPLSFEVASVKPARPLVPGESRGTKHGIDRLEFEYTTLRSCIVYAYRVKEFQVSAPAWMDDLRYDIVAKGPAGTRPDQLREMLQTLLADRFKLQIHRETKEFAGFALMVGKDGPKLDKMAEQSEDPGGNSMPPLEPGSFRMSPGRGGIGTRVVGNMSMAAVAECVSMQLGRPVTDMTQIAGNHDVVLDFSTFDTHGGGMMRVDGAPPPPVDSDPGV